MFLFLVITIWFLTFGNYKKDPWLISLSLLVCWDMDPGPWKHFLIAKLTGPYGWDGRDEWSLFEKLTDDWGRSPAHPEAPTGKPRHLHPTERRLHFSMGKLSKDLGHLWPRSPVFRLHHAVMFGSAQLLWRGVLDHHGVGGPWASALS